MAGAAYVATLAIAGPAEMATAGLETYWWDTAPEPLAP